MIVTAMGSPKVRFVERAGLTIMEELGSNNPWSTEWYCPRKDCLPCQGRAFLAEEEAERTLKLVTGEGEQTPQPKDRQAMKSLPSCTTEGMNYCLECISCRKAGTRRIYMGETSRSTYQRGKEHTKEIQDRTATHPFVMHCVEEHGGQIQPVLMRNLSTHLTPMDRQVQESLNIIREARKPGQCLNLKSEWAGAKIPGLEVSVPKGVSKPGKQTNETV